MLLTADRVISAQLRVFSAGLFWLLLALNLVNHALVFAFVNIQYVDSDQAFMWAGVADYAAGSFHEPRWYGQDYNTFLEALVAVPFYWMRIPVYYALPFATHLLAFLPFVFPAAYLYRRQEFQSALVFLAIPLCLSLAYDMMSGIPRGFVSGLAFTTFYVISLRDPKNLPALALNSILSVVGYFVNPNSLLVSAPFLFYLFLCNYRWPRYYIFSAVAIPAYALCYLLFDHFYRQHPDYIIYAVNLEFSFSFLKENLLHLHGRLAHAALFSDSHAWFLFAAYLLLCTGLWIFNRPAFYASLLVPAIILLTWCSNKGSDGSSWPFYSFSRSFIGLPLYFALFTSLIPWRNNFIMRMVTVLALTFSMYKLLSFRQNLEKHLDPANWLGVHLVKVPDAINAMTVYKNYCMKHGGQQLVVSNGFWLNTVLAYGGQAVQRDFPLSFETNYERRYWLREGLKEQVIERFIYISSINDLESRILQQSLKLERLDDYGLYVVKDNKLSNGDFILMVRAAEEKK